ncbi:hypothetical protein ACQY0O_007717 [Thecaphora frezii]
MSVTVPNPNSNHNRSHLLVPDHAPHDPVRALGHDACHGPPLSSHILVVLGVGPGLGLSIARTFAACGYTLAILSRSKHRLEAWAAELTAASTAAFECDALDPRSIHSALEQVQRRWPDRKIGTAAYNASIRIRAPFLELDHDKLQRSIDGSITGGFAFAQCILKAMEKHGQGGSLIFTGATSSVRGREGFATFAAAKSGLRSMCQSLAREFGPRNIHVAHVVVDGLIKSQEALDYLGMPPGSRFSDGAVRVCRNGHPDLVPT